MAMREEAKRAGFGERKGFGRKIATAAGVAVVGAVLSASAARAEGLKSVFVSPNEAIVRENPALLHDQEEQTRFGLELGPKHGKVDAILITKQAGKYVPVLKIGQNLVAVSEQRRDAEGNIETTTVPIVGVSSISAGWPGVVFKNLDLGAKGEVESGRGGRVSGAAGAALGLGKGIRLSGLWGTQEKQIGIHWDPSQQTRLSALLNSDVAAAELSQKIHDLMTTFTVGYKHGGGPVLRGSVQFGPWEVYGGAGIMPESGAKGGGFLGLNLRAKLPKFLGGGPAAGQVRLPQKKPQAKGRV